MIYVSANEDCPEYLDENTLAPTEVDPEPVFISPETESEPITDTEVAVEPITDTKVVVEPITDTEVSAEKSKKKFSCKLNENYYQHSIIACNFFSDYSYLQAFSISF